MQKQLFGYIYPSGELTKFCGDLKNDNGDLLTVGEKFSPKK